MNKIISFFSSVKEEARKVSWPTREQTIQTSIIVIIATLIVGGYVGIVDFLLDLVLKNYIL